MFFENHIVLKENKQNIEVYYKDTDRRKYVCINLQRISNFIDKNVNKG